VLLGSGDAIPLRTGNPRTALRFRQWYRVIEHPDTSARDRMELVITGYDYALLTADGNAELLAFHWHPEAQDPLGLERTVTFHHLHVGSAAAALQPLKKVHAPTGPTALKSVV